MMKFYAPKSSYRLLLRWTLSTHTDLYNTYKFMYTTCVSIFWYFCTYIWGHSFQFGPLHKVKATQWRHNLFLMSNGPFLHFSLSLSLSICVSPPSFHMSFRLPSSLHPKSKNIFQFWIQSFIFLLFPSTFITSTVN